MLRDFFYVERVSERPGAFRPVASHKCMLFSGAKSQAFPREHLSGVSEGLQESNHCTKIAQGDKWLGGCGVLAPQVGEGKSEVDL